MMDTPESISMVLRGLLSLLDQTINEQEKPNTGVLTAHERYCYIEGKRAGVEAALAVVSELVDDPEQKRQNKLLFSHGGRK